MTEEKEKKTVPAIRVLYVDDEPSLLNIGKLFLERGGAFVVDTLTSASEALIRLNTEMYDAIISDYQMPDMNGITFLKQLKASGDTTPFIIFTGRSREEVVIAALNEGADFYLQKGGEPKAQFTELAHKINSAVNRLRTEKLARNTEKRLYDIINFLPDATFAIDNEGNVIAWNRAIEDMTGVPARDMLGKSNDEYAIPLYGERRPILIDLVSVPDEELTRGKYAVIKKEGGILIAETSLPRPLGKYSVLLCKASLLYNDEGEGIGAIESMRDITEQKRVEEELLKKNEELIISFEQIAADEEELQAQFSALKEDQQQIQKKEQDYRSILENIQDVYYRSDAQGHLILASPSLATLLGYASVSELYGKSIAETLYYYPEEREKVLSDIKKNGSVTNYEVTFNKRDGTPVIISTSSHEYFDSAGNYLGVEGIFRDITERKLADDALKRSEDLYRTIFEITGAATIIIEQDTTISLSNSGFAKISGFSIEELEHKKSWTEFVVKEDLERMKQYHYGRRDDALYAPGVYEFRFITRYGEIRNCIVHVGVIPGTTRSVASVADITERVVIEQTLRESENLYRTIFDNTGAATIIIAPDTTILLANTGWERLTGVPRNEQENKLSWTVFIDKDDVERMKQYHYARRNDPTLPPKVYECKLIDAKNTVHLCHVYVDIIPGSGNSVASLVDITERVLAEQALLQRNEELNATFEQLTATEEELRRLYIDLEKKVEERTAELHAANTALQSEVSSRVLADDALYQANKKLTLLSSITRHDINNQLLALNGLLVLLHRKAPDPILEDFFTRIEKASSRISAMIKFTEKYEQIGVNAPVWQDCRTLIDTAAKQAPIGKVTVENNLLPGTEVFADPLIVKVFYNLMDNAVRYGGKITTIQFSAEGRGDDKVIVCEDDGIGILAEEKEKIFNPGFGKNTGLGLALSREVFNLTGITIVETGEPGKGARFEMMVPKGMWRMAGKSD